MLLTDEERRRFAAWLLHDAESNKLLIEQFDKMGHNPAYKVLKDMKVREYEAELIVAKMLSQTSSYTVGGPSSLTVGGT